MHLGMIVNEKPLCICIQLRLKFKCCFCHRVSSLWSILVLPLGMVLVSTSIAASGLRSKCCNKKDSVR